MHVRIIKKHISRKRIRNHVFRVAIVAHLAHATMGLAEHILSAESYVVATVSLAEVLILATDATESREHEHMESAVPSAT